MRYGMSLAALAAAGLLAATTVSAQPPAGGTMRQRGGGPPAQMQGQRAMRQARPAGPMAQLNLTQEQRQQMRELANADREANKAAFAKMPELQRQLREAIFLGKGDVNGIAHQITELQAQMLQARISHQQKVAAILTDEQRAQMAKMPAGPGRRGADRMRRGPDGPPVPPKK